MAAEGTPAPGTTGRPSAGAVSMEFDEREPINRFWGIPLLGHFARMLVLFPHWVVLSVLGTLVGLLLLVTWIPVLLEGRFPSWGYNIIGGYYRWSNRVAAYLLMLTDRYPPFWFAGEHPVRVEFDEAARINPLWGIPFVGMVVRGILVIPHLVVLWLVSIVGFFVLLVSWIPVLVDGRMASWGYTILGGSLRWAMRVTAYVLLMTSEYPPFRLRP